MSQFIFESFGFDKETRTATFTYRFGDERRFEETATFEVADTYNEEVLLRALFLAFLLIGTSYFKTFPTKEISLELRQLDDWTVQFLNKVYQEGLSQFAFENNLNREDLAHFEATGSSLGAPVNPLGALAYQGNGTLLLQSGGKDSLLTIALLNEKSQPFTPWYVANSDHHPAVLDELEQELAITRRTIDKTALEAAAADGAKNGHVPVTYIIESLALIQAVLLGKNEVLVSIAHEGEEPHAAIGDLEVSHQWSKTWAAEQLMAEYVNRYISPDLKIGSPLRRFSELQVAELFIQRAWQKFGHRFSSCNRANYKQGDDNSELRWCGECPKCANSFLLFAPFLSSRELKSIFSGQDLFTKPTLEQTFKGLLGIDGVPKPFECVGEIDELRLAYHKSQEKGGYESLPFDVPESNFDYLQTYPAQDWAVKMLQ